ncbi:TPR-like protein [Saccharata proteae CBS 121410]|uniref:TPR-like protein n=1 Tax=Saccharata proteae CBS 121410 TaxID=1314787 RepID=A0A9P4LTC7_9PEZI|nr:TPR-like protein [Saccharata proteae CBS 121410]
MAPSPTNKAALKSAKAALDAQDWDQAVTQSQNVLSSDPENYFARLFLGRALEKRGQLEEAAKAYEDAAKSKPEDDQAWLGLRLLYEGQGGKKVDGVLEVGRRLAELYAARDDKDRCQTAVNKMVDFTRSNGSKAQYKRALEIQLPTSPVYACVEGRVPHPSHTYTRLAEITEAEEKERINKEIGERRTRLGARIGQVTTEVKREVYGRSKLEELYQNVIDWIQDDEVRREYEEKLLLRAYDALVVSPAEKKEGKRKQVLGLANGMVVIKHPFKLAWELELEWRDLEEIREFDANVVREFIEFFPEHGLSRVLRGYLTSEVAPFPLRLEKLEKNDADGENKEENEVPDDESLGAEDRLLLMTEGLDDAKESALAHRIMAFYFLHLEEHETAVETARKGLKLLASSSQKSGLQLQNNFDAVNSTLATSLIQYQSPKNHPEAKSLFHSILERKPTFTSALIGVGLILEEEEEYAEAIDFLTRALSRDPDNLRIGAEAAWCKALNGDYAKGVQELEHYLEEMKTTDARSRDLRAQTLYRIAMCIWELDPTRAARKDRTGAYSKLLAAIKTNPGFAPAYTSLGIYYADYARDKKRARQCFQKAFELSGSEIEAAERLARSFADQGEWDIVEVIAQRTIDSGKVRPSPGSKKKGVSWPFSALGIVQMNKQEYSKSIISFLSALRISPDDYHSYVGLGESYHNSGRYNSALRTFRYAEEPTDGVQMKKTGDNWFTRYMLANVNRELGQFDEAIVGYRDVLKDRPKEFGVSLALLQSLVERGWRDIETGFFGQAADSARDAIDVAESVANYKPEAFNLWKAVGDACSIFSAVQSRVEDLPLEKIKSLLETSPNTDYNIFEDIDGIGNDAFGQLLEIKAEDPLSPLWQCIKAAILAQKRAIHSSAQDIHAQAVAWYNLGWTEYRAHACLEHHQPDPVHPNKKPLRFLKAAMRCFKRAIELEAGNAEFWNSLGVVTTQMNPKVAQHSFVRSLHLNERSARTWTNLGTLYLLQNDHELAHLAFARAQSTDPDYAHAWLGEGLIALLLGDTKEALSHFTHAFEISDSASLVVKRQYAVSTFDHLLSTTASSHDKDDNNLNNLIQPLFALQQLRSQSLSDLPHQHLSALFLERVGNHDDAISALADICSAAEQDFENTESPASLSRFARAKTDLARNRLAAKEFAAAVEDAETVLDLVSEDSDTGLDVAELQKVRLSANLTAGLAQYYLNVHDASISHFRAALTLSGSSPDVVCLLAEVLWAKGGTEEKNVAREQLFACVEEAQSQEKSHVGAVLLLGVMAAVEGDTDTMEAVKEDLENMRTREDVGAKELKRVETVLGAIASVSAPDDENQEKEAAEEAAKTGILLSPFAPHGWSELAKTRTAGVKGDEKESFPAQMALLTAKQAVPPRGPLGAEELAGAFAGTGTLRDAQRGVCVAPWRGEAWAVLGDVVAGAGG